MTLRITLGLCMNLDTEIPLFILNDTLQEND